MLGMTPLVSISVRRLGLMTNSSMPRICDKDVLESSTSRKVIPSIYRLYVLSVIYRADFTELLKWYGVDLSSTAADFAICRPVNTTRGEIAEGRGTVHIPVK